MTGKPVSLRSRARHDIDEALDHYRVAAREAVTLGFVDALEDAFANLAAQPAIGSLRYAYELDLPGLRVWPLRKYPWLIFYTDIGQQIDVWRVLHAKRDIPAWMAKPPGDG